MSSLRRFYFFLFLLVSFSMLSADYASDLDPIVPILEPLVEENPDLDVESVEEKLRELLEHPIDLNRTSTGELEQLLWLTPEQIDNILLYAYYHPFESVYELRLVPGLSAYDVQLLAPFVIVAPREVKDTRTVRGLFSHASHELHLRADARSLTTFQGDPFYGYFKYKCNAGNKVLFGVTFKRDVAEIPNKHSRYGAFAELHDVGPLSTLVVGDYRASFGYGLVINSALPLGKSTYATRLGLSETGIKKYNGCSDDFLRGVGATVDLLPKGDVKTGQKLQLSAFYSCRLPDSIARQVAGANLSYTYRRLRVGMTAMEYWVTDSLPFRNTYYNTHYFRGKRQFSGSVNAQYMFRHVTLLAEAATSQNTSWGGALLTGARVTPMSDLSLLMLYRYYSLYYDPVLASTFSETTRPNDEQGAYLGADIRLVRNWLFSAYTDFFFFSGPKYTIRVPSWGYDILAEADFVPSERFSLLLRSRSKRKGEKDLYSLRFQVNNKWHDWSLRTEVDGNICVTRPDEDEPVKAYHQLPATYGIALYEQVEYRLPVLPMVFQLRVGGFYIPNWNNRIYAYENDVLYAFSIPATYGKGVRAYLNWRYAVTDKLSLYLRVSDTWYAPSWVEERELASAHKPDVHLLFRVTL